MKYTSTEINLGAYHLRTNRARKSLGMEARVRGQGMVRRTNDKAARV